MASCIHKTHYNFTSRAHSTSPRPVIHNAITFAIRPDFQKSRSLINNSMHQKHASPNVTQTYLQSRPNILFLYTITL